ncbi:hypothetical protein ACW9UR_01550 [Halovulum sp. GXIMD14794]
MPARAALVGMILCNAAQVAADTDPLTITGIDWQNCLDLIDQMRAQHAARGAGEPMEERTLHVRTTAVMTTDEIIVLRCDRADLPITFTLRASPL